MWINIKIRGSSSNVITAFKRLFKKFSAQQL